VSCPLFYSALRQGTEPDHVCNQPGRGRVSRWRGSAGRLGREAVLPEGPCLRVRPASRIAVNHPCSRNAVSRTDTSESLSRERVCPRRRRLPDLPGTDRPYRTHPARRPPSLAAPDSLRSAGTPLPSGPAPQPPPGCTVRATSAFLLLDGRALVARTVHPLGQPARDVSGEPVDDPVRPGRRGSVSPGRPSGESAWQPQERSAKYVGTARGPKRVPRAAQAARKRLSYFAEPPANRSRAEGDKRIAGSKR
jgi:hypothetical protein